MKDSVYLLGTALACVAAIMAFNRFFGADASGIMTTVMVLSLVYDNFKLRKKLRDLQPK